jgi:hypothetical protein
VARRAAQRLYALHAMVTKMPRTNPPLGWSIIVTLAGARAFILGLPEWS